MELMGIFWFLSMIFVKLKKFVYIRGWALVKMVMNLQVP
jgi:hypothetical protein